MSNNEVLNIETLTAVDVYGENLDALLDKVEKEAKAHQPDISTPQGREEIASVAYRVARTKTALDAMGKELTEEARKTVEKVNAERKRMRDRLDSLKEEVRAPLTEWENLEKSRVADLEDRIESLRQSAVFVETPTSLDIQNAMQSANALYQYDWQEFQAKADYIWNEINPRLSSMLEERKKYEDEQKELEKLRREAEERRQRDHEEKLKKEAAEKARREAEEKAREEREAAEAKLKAEAAERERIAAEKAQKAIEEKQRIEREKKAAEARAEAAEKARIEAQERAKREAEEAAIRAEEQKQAAILAEKERQAREEQARQEEIKRREADMFHKQKIYNEAISGIQAAGIGENDARKALDAIVDGKVPHVNVIY